MLHLIDLDLILFEFKASVKGKIFNNKQTKNWKYGQNEVRAYLLFFGDPLHLDAWYVTIWKKFIFSVVVWLDRLLAIVVNAVAYLSVAECEVLAHMENRLLL